MKLIKTADYILCLLFGDLNSEGSEWQASPVQVDLKSGLVQIWNGQIVVGLQQMVWSLIEIRNLKAQ